MAKQRTALVRRLEAEAATGSLVRLLTAAAATLGGIIWSWTVITTALRPVGVPGAHRSTLDLHPTILVAFILMGVAATALAGWRLKSRLAWTGATLVWLGALVFAINVAFVLTTGDDAPVWPTHYLGIFVVGLGSTIVGVAILRARVMPAAVALVLIAAAPILLFSQMQNARVLLWLPLGGGWLAVGLLLAWRSESGSGASATSVQHHDK